jgi:hypothetical protein
VENAILTTVPRGFRVSGSRTFRRSPIYVRAPSGTVVAPRIRSDGHPSNAPETRDASQGGTNMAPGTSNWTAAGTALGLPRKIQEASMSHQPHQPTRWDRDLKLESTKGPVDVLVIDHLEQPTPDSE